VAKRSRGRRGKELVSVAKTAVNATLEQAKANLVMNVAAVNIEELPFLFAYMMVSMSAATFHNAVNLPSAFPSPKTGKR
jgi:hypothetical protein